MSSLVMSPSEKKSLLSNNSVSLIPSVNKGFKCYLKNNKMDQNTAKTSAFIKEKKRKNKANNKCHFLIEEKFRFLDVCVWVDLISFQVFKAFSS